MALKENQEETPISENPNGDEEGGEESQADGVGDFEDEDEDEAEEEDEEEEARSEKSRESRLAEDGSKLESMFRRLASEKVKLRVHDVLIKGNTKTKDSLIEAELEAIKNATTMQELLKAAGIANHRFHSFGIFDSVGITLDCGPPELPGTVNVIVDVVETKNPLTGDLGIFTKPEVLSLSLYICIRSMYLVLILFIGCEKCSVWLLRREKKINRIVLFGWKTRWSTVLTFVNDSLTWASFIRTHIFNLRIIVDRCGGLGVRTHI